MREPSKRAMTWSYMAALTLIAAMTVASHLTLDGILREHEGAASVINVSGRQRMYSQRIASMASQHALGMPQAQRDLLEAVDQFERGHAQLIIGDQGLNLPRASHPDLQAIYFGGDRPLNALVNAFLGRARLIATFPAGDPALTEQLEPLLLTARSSLLDRLDEVVSVHQSVSEQRLRQLQWMQVLSLIVVLATLVVEALGIFRPMVHRIAHYTNALMQLASTDALTGALNRRSFTERALAELNRANRYGRETSLLLIDADRFKAVNDRFGHGGGDLVLQALSMSLSDCLRPSDLLGRIGGEEFVVLLAETGLAGAEAAAERIRRTIEQLAVPHEHETIRFTISIGVASCMPGPHGLKRAMDSADQALYAAKESGRNRVVTSNNAVPRDAAAAA